MHCLQHSQYTKTLLATLEKATTSAANNLVASNALATCC